MNIIARLTAYCCYNLPLFVKRVVIDYANHIAFRNASGFPALKGKQKSYFYCGSIVAGGLLDTAYVTQVTPSTSFVILLLIFSINS